MASTRMPCCASVAATTGPTAATSTVPQRRSHRLGRRGAVEPLHLRLRRERDGVHLAGAHPLQQFAHARIVDRIGVDIGRDGQRQRAGGFQETQQLAAGLAAVELHADAAALRSWRASVAMTPAVVGASASRSLCSPSSRSARAGFGPRVILRTAPSAARNAGSSAGSWRSRQPRRRRRPSPVSRMRSSQLPAANRRSHSSTGRGRGRPGS